MYMKNPELYIVTEVLILMDVFYILHHLLTYFQTSQNAKTFTQIKTDNLPSLVN